jgi:hypothetical protein
MCYQCQALTELCPECQEQKDNRDIHIAHQIVDEGNMRYKHIWSIQSEPASGHDWTDREGEFLPPIAMLEDRLFDLDSSITITPAEVLCQDCHLVFNKWSNCPNCH